MIARAKTKRTKPAPGRARKKSAATTKKPTIAELQRERDALQTKLKAAQARILELEKLNADSINRIDWVIDSLQTALDAGH